MLKLPDDIIVKDFVSDLVDEMKDTGAISAVDNGDGTYTITTVPLRLNDYYWVTIASVQYKIFNVTSTTFDITSTVAPTGTWQTYIPYYYGTPLETGNVRTKDKDDGKLKYPFVALFEPFDTTENLDIEEKIYLEPDLWMVFMTEANYQDWTTEEHYTYAINPMSSLARDFLLLCKEKEGGTLSELNTLTRVKHAKWGLVARMSGHTATVFSDNLSGIELRFNLPINKKYTCS